MSADTELRVRVDGLEGSISRRFASHDERLLLVNERQNNFEESFQRHTKNHHGTRTAVTNVGASGFAMSIVIAAWQLLSRLF